MPVAGKVDSGVERVIGLMVMNRPGQTGATSEPTTRFLLAIESAIARN